MQHGRITLSLSALGLCVLCCRMDAQSSSMRTMTATARWRSMRLTWALSSLARPARRPSPFVFSRWSLRLPP